MKPTTIQRHRLIRREFNKLIGTMPVMRLYVVLGERFGLSDETVRQILSRKNKPPN